MNLQIDDGMGSKIRKSWWKQRTSIQRTVILFVLISIAVVTFFVLSLLIAKTVNSTSHTICLTRGCVRAAEEILRHIDPSVDPCEDFNQFSCGEFLKNAIIPQERTMITSYSSIHALLEEKLQAMLQEPLSNTSAKPLQLLTKLYGLCINITAIENAGLKTIRRIVQEFGGWPVIDGENWNESKFNWVEATYKFRKTGLPVNIFTSIDVSPHPKNSTRQIVEVNEASLGLNRENLLNGLDDKVVKAYYNLYLNLATAFGANRNKIEEEVREVIQFQIKLAKITTPPEERRNVSNFINFFSVSEVQKRYPSISWLQFINKLLTSPTDSLTENDIILVSSPKYIENLEILLSNTTKRVQANYAIFKAVKTSAVFLPESIRKYLKDFMKITYGAVLDVPRHKECVSAVTTTLDIAAASMYVRKYFKKESKEGVKEIVKNIQSEFKTILKQSDWMDEVTKKKAKEKADAMVVHIGYPDELLDTKALENYYSGLNAANDYFTFILNILKFSMDKSYSKLWKPVNQSDWTTRTMPITLNAGYRPLENSIEFPAAILQGIFFQHDRPQYLNYGGIGYVIGHEITHGFDDRGKQFDKSGNVFDWWEETTNQAYRSKSQCIIEQYGNYTVPEISKNVNGIITQGENIADNGGIKEAYFAYNKWVEQNYEEPLLPGINYTQRQMFWISSAILWCSKERSEVLEQLNSMDSHAPARFRTQGPLRNSKEFANDFNCPIGSKMNPAKKCSVW